jgi:DNA-binding NarL/FixJ family response regulator
MTPRHGRTEWAPVVAAGLRDLETFLRASIQLLRERERREREQAERWRRREQQRRLSEERRAARQARNQEIAELQAEGLGYKRIARELNLNVSTTRDICRALRRA